MAGRGPAPKHPAQRRNRTAPTRGEWIELAPLAEPVLGQLPDLESGEWRPQTVETWESWRLDPVTAQWSPADRAYALDAIRLHNAMTTATAANEVRLRMDGLGLTPKGKRDLRWHVVEESDRVPAEVVPISRDDRKRRLARPVERSKR